MCLTYNSAEKNILTLCRFTGRMSFSFNERGRLRIHVRKDKSIIKIHMKSHVTCTNQCSVFKLRVTKRFLNLTHTNRHIKQNKTLEYLLQLLWCIFVLFFLTIALKCRTLVKKTSIHLKIVLIIELMYCILVYIIYYTYIYTHTIIY